MKDLKVFVAGHGGMVGSSIVNNLKSKGYSNIITRTRKELDLLNQADVKSFFARENIDHVILCAAKVGGILANNTYRADFIYENLEISCNIIKSSHDFGVKKLINLGSSCIYPRNSQIPIREEYLLSGKLEQTNEPYAISKIAALKMCESFYHQYGSDFYSIMPCNLYGPRDNFNKETSHVLPALMLKIDEAKRSGSNSASIWGTGKPLREFLYVDDLANTATYLLENISAEQIYSKGISHLNCGSRQEVSIFDLAHIIRDEVGFEGKLVFDDSKPDGTFRKKMDNTRVAELGINQSFLLKEGIKKTYDWYLKNILINNC